MTGDEMVGWHHRLDEHAFKQAAGVGDRQVSLACCSPLTWGQLGWYRFLALMNLVMAVLTANTSVELRGHRSYKTADGRRNAQIPLDG